MKKFKYFSVLAFILLILYPNRDISAQKWKEIVPLASTCEDVKKILKVTSCEFPISEYKFPKYNITVYFSTEKDEWDVSKETVVNVLVILKELVLLQDYETDLAGYELIPEDDLPEQNIYINDKHGIRITVTTLQDEKWVKSIYLYPPQKNKERAKCKDRF